MRLLLLVCIVFSAIAEETGTTTASRTVVVPVVVRDKQGSEVTNLSAASFEVQDKGKTRPISSFELVRSGAPGPDGQPILRYTGYLIDDLYVRDAGDFHNMIKLVRRHVSEMGPYDRAAIYTASCSAALNDWTGNQQQVQQFLAQLNPYTIGPGRCRVSGSQSLHVYLIRGLVSRMLSLSGLRNVVVFSPGYELLSDKQSQQSDLIEFAGESRVIISSVFTSVSSIGFGSVGPALTQLCEATGGSDTGNIPSALYLLDLKIDDVKPDGSVHKLKVLVKDSRKLSVQARRSYTASSK